MLVRRYLWMCKPPLGSKCSITSASRLLSSFHQCSTPRRGQSCPVGVATVAKAPQKSTALRGLQTTEQDASLSSSSSCNKHLLWPLEGASQQLLSLSPTPILVEKEYQCPSRLLEHFSQLVILDSVVDKTPSYECPVSSVLIHPLIAPNVRDSEITEPPVNSPENAPGKYAKHIMKIRHKKMKKHKLRKLRKRMYYVWKKAKLARKTKRRAIYQKELDDIRKTGDDFDAGDFVREQLRKARRGGYYINIFQSRG